MISYFDFDGAGSTIVNRASATAGTLTNGTLVRGQRVRGRWQGDDGAVEFRRPGSRVRVFVPGEFSAMTFTAWVRIDSLDRKYNALFMSDGYENGEPHWQIRDDGRLMLSVMVDDTFVGNEPQNQGFHHVYYSNQIWNIADSGRWMHLASSFDPAHRRVRHYVDGTMVSEEQITDEFFVDRLRIKASEIGNWGDPFENSEWFAIRNLNGQIDDLAIYREVIGPDEIKEIYVQSRR